MTSHRIALLVGAVLFGIAGSAQAAGDITIVRDLASRVGPVIGSAQACRDIARPRIQTIVDKFSQVIREASSNEAERSDLTQTFDRTVAEGRAAVTSGRMDCIRADRQLADLERSISGPSLSSVIGPSPAAAATAANAATAPTANVPAGPLPRGIGEKEIRFGIAAPFSGSARELGRQMKLGIETAFNRINEAGGVDGRMLKLFAADDGYEPARTLEAMKQLYEKDQVFGIVGNVGTPTAAVAIPYALERRMLFFGAFTGANILRNDPPDRYVFNYRASYVQETDAVVRYLVKMRRLQPRQIAVFAQQDFVRRCRICGRRKGVPLDGRERRRDPSAQLCAKHRRRGRRDQSVEAREAADQGGGHGRDLPGRGKVHREDARRSIPGMIYSNVSFVGSTALAEELKLLGPRYTNGVIVTQVVPAVSGYSSAVLEYKNALAKYFPGEAADYVSFEGYVAANVLIAGIKRAGPQLDTEKLIDTLETMRNLDLGLGTQLSFGRSEHQASNKVWGTALDESGRYQPLELE